MTTTPTPYQQFQIPRDQVSQLPRQMEVPLRNLPARLPVLELPKPNQNALPDMPRLETPLPKSNGGLVDKLNNGAARVGGAIVLAQQAGNLIKNPDIGNAATSVGSALLLVPNPKAQLAGYLALGLGSLINAFKPQANLQPTNNNGNTGDIGTSQTFGNNNEVYRLVFQAELQTNPPQLVTQNARGRGGQINGFFGTVTISDSYDDTTNGYWVFNVTDSQGSFVAGADFQSPSNFTQNAKYTKPSLVSIIKVSDNSSIPVPAPQPSTPSEGIATPVQNDGWEAPDLDRFKDNALNPKGIEKTNNGVTPIAVNRVPKPNPTGTPQNIVPSTSASPPSSVLLLKPQNTPTAQPNSTPSQSKAPLPKTAPETKPQSQPAKTKEQDERLKQSDCKFSCKALADCFSDVTVKIFDGCDPNSGEAKTKDIVVQALPKNRASVIATFAELLKIRSRECSLSDRVQTSPEYWATRRGQIPQAIILFKTTTNGASGEPSYYQLQIPHYNGGKNSKPNIPTYQKGEHMAIYECIDGSQMQVYASTDAEAVRVLNALEKYINPRMRMKDKKNIKTGKRGGMAKITVKPIRLDFSSKGQAQKAPDWSIPL